MNNFELGRMLTKFTNTQMFGMRQTAPQPAAESFVENLQPAPASQTTANTANLQMNTLQSMDRAIYAKEVMQFPRNLNEFIYMVQKGMTQAQFNQMFAQHIAAQKNALSQTQAQILPSYRGLVFQTKFKQ